jgi:hypothetical protein
MSDPRIRRGWATVFLVLGAVAILVSAIACSVAGQRWWHRRTVAKEWRLVEARVEDCSLDERLYPGGLGYLVRCALRFNVAGKEIRGGFDSPHEVEDVDQLRAWVARHPQGSKLVVKYDPSSPSNVVVDPLPAFFDAWLTRTPLEVTWIATSVAIILTIIGLMLRG